MMDHTQRWIELRRRERQADGTWSCHYVIFEFGPRAWRCKKGRCWGHLQHPRRGGSRRADTGATDRWFTSNLASSR